MLLFTDSREGRGDAVSYVEPPASPSRSIQDVPACAHPLATLLENVSGVRYDLRENIPGVSFHKDGRADWTPVKVIRCDPDSDEKAVAVGEYDVNYLRDCKEISYVNSKLHPSFLLHYGRCRFTTLIALRTQSKLF